MRHDPLQQRSLDGQILGNGLDHPIALSEPGQVLIKIAGRDERGQGSIIEGGWPGFGQGIERRECQLVLYGFARGNHVEENCGNAGVGQVSGDPRAHCSCAEYRGAADKERKADSGNRLGGCCKRRSGAHAYPPTGGLEGATHHPTGTLEGYGTAPGVVKERKESANLAAVTTSFGDVQRRCSRQGRR